MSRDGSCEFDFADGTYRFRIGIGEARELQEKTGCGPYFLFSRIAKDDWRVDDIRETIRLGLIGGGTEPVKALDIVRRYVDERPLSLLNVPTAKAILMAGLAGAPDGEKPGKARAARAKSNPKPSTDGSPLPPTTEPARS